MHAHQWSNEERGVPATDEQMAPLDMMSSQTGDSNGANAFGPAQGPLQGMFGADPSQSNFQNDGWGGQDRFNPMFGNAQNAMPNGQWNMMPNVMGELQPCAPE